MFVVFVKSCFWSWVRGHSFKDLLCKSPWPKLGKAWSLQTMVWAPPMCEEQTEVTLNGMTLPRDDKKITAVKHLICSWAWFALSCLFFEMPCASMVPVAACGNFWADLIGAKNWTLTFFSHTFRAPLGYAGKKPGISRPKVWFPWVLKDTPNVLAPTRSRGRQPPHQKIYGPKSLGSGGANFIPPHPWKYPSRGGGRIQEGGLIKFLLRGVRNIHPPLPLKNAFWPKFWGGGGGIKFFLQVCALFSCLIWMTLPCSCCPCILSLILLAEDISQISGRTLFACSPLESSQCPKITCHWSQKGSTLVWTLFPPSVRGVSWNRRLQPSRVFAIKGTSWPHSQPG